MNMNGIPRLDMAYTTYNNTSYTLSDYDGHVNVSDLHHTDSYVYDVNYRAKIILSRPQNIIILILGTIAIVSNIFSILAICKMGRSSLTSHFRLILNLAVSDVLIGFSLILFLFINAFVELFPVGVGPEDKRLTSRCLFCFSKALNNTGLAITLLNLLAMAVDHYIAIMRPLHYAIILSRQRSIYMIAIFWAVAILLGFSDYFSAYPKYSRPHLRDKYNYCEFIHMTKYNEEYPIFVLSLICLICMMFIYIRIYIEVKKHQARSPQASQDLNKNKKAIATTLLILGSFILCWLPMSMFTLIVVILVYVNPEFVAKRTNVLYQVDSSLFILLLLNVIADPIIYAIRVQEVQFGYRRLFCRPSLPRHRHRSYRSNDSSQYLTFTEQPSKSCGRPKSIIVSKNNYNETVIPMIPPEIRVTSPID